VYYSNGADLKILAHVECQQLVPAFLLNSQIFKALGV
jgi:hypothetical protein